jgi:hypothetical protein
MKVIRREILIAIVMGLILVLEFFPLYRLEATDIVNVYLESNDKVNIGDDFVVKVCINNVEYLQAYQVRIQYDNSVISLLEDVEGKDVVSPGMVGGTAIPIDMYSISAGTSKGIIRIVGRVEGQTTASGSGYLAEIRFIAVGNVGERSDIEPVDSGSYKNRIIDYIDNQEHYISTNLPWGAASIEIVDPGPLNISTQEMPDAVEYRSYYAQLEANGGYEPYSWSASGLPLELVISESGVITGIPLYPGHYPVEIQVSDDFKPPHIISKQMYLNVALAGDANGDGFVNKQDVDKLIRMYLGLAEKKPAADANGDGIISMNDAITIQQIYMNKE